MNSSPTMLLNAEDDRGAAHAPWANTNDHANPSITNRNMCGSKDVLQNAPRGTKEGASLQQHSHWHGREGRTTKRRQQGLRIPHQLAVIALWCCCSLLLSATPARAAIPCTNDKECKEWIGSNSVCLVSTQTCSNHFASGCLHSHDPEKYPKRMCNSNDERAGSLKDGSCIADNGFNYTEIRIHHSNWEASIFYSWMMQIFLSERLGVPVTVGLDGDVKNSFYSPANTLEYSSETYSFPAMEVANQIHDCRLLSKGTANSDPVIRDLIQKTSGPDHCLHVMPEVWGGVAKQVQLAVRQGIIDPVEGNGQVGKVSWYIPTHTAETYPDFTSYHGLTEGPLGFAEAVQGTDSKRQELASIFKRPTTWKDYCADVSPSNCAEPDLVAQRAPDEDEGGRYFLESAFTGHFRATDDNNCTLSDKCTGHIAAPPCSWTSFIDAQLYWNNVPLSSNGEEPNGSYTYGQMVDIWKAANATKSHVMMWWWTPEALVETFRGTGFGFQQILLPDATATCKRARVTPGERCSSDEVERRGTIEGSCDSEAHALQKAIATTLGIRTLATPVADRSPAYEFLRSFRIDNLDMNEILHNWIVLQQDQYGHDARQAVCDWIVDNLETLDDFIPLGYPRELSLESTYDQGYLVAAQVIGGVAAACVVAMGTFIFYRRHTRVMVFAQVNFILLLIAGLFLVTIAAIVYVVEPSSSICIGREWLVAVGYTLALVPLVVKFAALNQVVQSARKMKRVRISAKAMFCRVAVLVTIVMIYLTVWTIMDTPRKVEERELVEEGGAQVVSSLKCGSNSWLWEGLALGWQGFLLLMATVLAVQTRSVQQEFNESRSLGTLVYSHFMFMVLRIMVNLLENQGTIEPNVSSATISFLLSFDVLFAMCIYLAPKVMEAHKKPEPYRRKGSSSTPQTNANNGNTHGSRHFRPSGGERLRGTLQTSTHKKKAKFSSCSSTPGRQQESPNKAQTFEPFHQSKHSGEDSASDPSTEDRFGSSLDDVVVGATTSTAKIDATAYNIPPPTV